MPSGRSTSYSTSAGTSYPSYSYPDYTTTTSRPRTSRRPPTGRPRTGASTRLEAQQIICAVTESRGVSPVVGIAFVNLDTAEAVMSQINDNPTYVRTINKVTVFAPSEVLINSTAAAGEGSTLFNLLQENQDILGCKLSLVDRRYFSETLGIESINRLAFVEDVEAIKVSIDGNYFAVCCFAAVLKYIELQLGKRFPSHTLRMKYEPSEGAMMIDLSTIHSLELIQNIQNPKSKHCLFGLMNETLTPMGARVLRSSILQPSIDPDVIERRLDAVTELTTKEDMFFATRQALKGIVDSEKTLSALVVIPTDFKIKHLEQSINNVIMLKQFVYAIRPVREALADAQSYLLTQLLTLCSADNINIISAMIDHVLNDDIHYAKSARELRNQRVFAVRVGVNGLLDVARQSYKEATQDAISLSEELANEHQLGLELKYDSSRHFYLRFAASELEGGRLLDPLFINVVKRKHMIECQTLDLVKTNSKIKEAADEVLGMSDQTVQQLVDALREKMVILYKSSESIALLDMLTAFAHLATSQDYVRPKLEDTLAIQASRHPIREKFHALKYIPNDVYATQQSRFQIITGCNMSGKSTYIRSIALLSVMAQVGSFVPATWASFPILHQLFARVSTDNNIEANVSTFAAEMRETAFILRNIDRRSMAIVDELGRGTSTRDGLAIAIAIAEALVQSRALVWFATHFRDLAAIMAERNGVINLHFRVDMGSNSGGDSMKMLYKIAQGAVTETHYGLALAKVVPLPAKVLEVAEQVAAKLERAVKRRKKTSAAVIHERRRKLILNLKEHLVQAHSGTMEGDVLKSWLKELQREFVVRMTAIEADAEEADEQDDCSQTEEGDDDAMET